MSKFHFFTDPTKLAVQGSSSAYGPVAGSATHDEFRLCSMHQVSATADAYAVCAGTVFVQEVSGSPSLVNLILKPDERPKVDMGYIQYFIYRGITKSSLITGNLINVNSNDLTTQMKATQDALNANIDEELGNQVPTTDDPSSSALGIDLISPNYEDSDKIDKLFYREDDNYQFPRVLGSWVIGEFAPSSDIGFEVIFEKIGTNSTLEVARSADHVLSITKLTSSNQEDIFSHWDKKEEILHYMDPAAFFGGFFSSKLRVNVNGNWSNESGNDLYDNVLSKFFNKNIVYLDIRNEHSMNYFQNYAGDIKIAYDDTSTLVTRDYYDEGWPIIRITNFSGTNDDEKNILRLTLPIGDNLEPMLVLQSMVRLNKGNSSSSLPKLPKGSGKFHVPEIDLTPGCVFSEEIEFVVPNRDGISATTPVACHMKFMYCKQFDESKYPWKSEGTTFNRTHHLDNLFPLFQMHEFPFIETAGSSNILIRVYNEEIYLDDSFALGWDFTAALGVAFIDKRSGINIFEDDGVWGLTISKYNEATAWMKDTDFVKNFLFYGDDDDNANNPNPDRN
jgi:hypothetical protein